MDFLSMHRLQLIRTTSIMLTFGAIVSLVTGDWWLLPLAAGVHALGTMTVVMTSIRMTTITEHPSPEVAAAMSAEGVTSPDERFSQMVEEFSSEPGAGTSEVLSPGANERTTDATADTATAAGEQSSAMTPTGQRSHPGGAGGAPDILIWTTALSLLALSIVLPAVMGGGWMWLLPAVMVPLLAGWMGLQWLMIARPDKAQPRGRGALIAIGLATAAAVATFCAVVALAFQH
jgi:hypothetical protein